MKLRWEGPPHLIPLFAICLLIALACLLVCVNQHLWRGYDICEGDFLAYGKRGTTKQPVSKNSGLSVKEEEEEGQECVRRCCRPHTRLSDPFP